MPLLQARALAAPHSIFAHMSALAQQHGAVNLGQGFPAACPPEFLLAAARAQLGQVDQYVPPAGWPPLREALAQDLGVQAEDIVVSTGASEALHLLALCLSGPGDEVLVIEPAYDVYRPQVRLAGAVPVSVPLEPQPDGRWLLDPGRVKAAISARTRALIINNPHNPTGTVFSRELLSELVALARQHDLWIVADEVYDELYFSQAPSPLRSLAPERTFTVGSAGKRLEATGWRVGWIHAPAGQAQALLGLRQISSFCAPAPLQAALAQALPLARQNGFYQQLRQTYAQRHDVLCRGLADLGTTVYPAQGSYFLTATHPSWTAERLVQEAKVAAIPGEAFYEAHPAPAQLLRFAFCKAQADLETALERLGEWHRNQ